MGSNGATADAATMLPCQQDVKVIVASHKPYWMPDDPCYLPVWVGAATRGEGAPAGWRCDDEGDSISERNPSYCELTALYWAWKNLDADYLGLAHYRRHFAEGSLGPAATRVASGAFLAQLLDRAPIILPIERNYFIETNYSQYAHAHHEADLTTTRDVLCDLHPEVVPAWDATMARTHGHRFNMFVMRRDLADAWCEFLFPALFELERRLDTSSYSANDARVYGFVAERLLDPWLQTNGLDHVSLPVVNMESQHWPRKAAAFVGRKLRGGSAS